MIFLSLDLASEIQHALDACGYKQMTPYTGASDRNSAKSSDVYFR